MDYICKSPSKEIKIAMMEVFRKQINASGGRVSIKAAENISDAYIMAKNKTCPPGFKLGSPCGMCQGGLDYKIVHK